MCRARLRPKHRLARVERVRYALSLPLFLGLALAQPGTSPFVDVPPCHWARPALEAIAHPSPQARPQPSLLLAENALLQVFEGLRCNDPAWSLRFLLNPAPGFGQNPSGLRGFELRVLQSALAGSQATLRFALTAMVEGATLRRNSTARLVFEPEGWKVDYASLAALELPLFPR